MFGKKTATSLQRNSLIALLHLLHEAGFDSSKVSVAVANPLLDNLRIKRLTTEHRGILAPDWRLIRLQVGEQIRTFHVLKCHIECECVFTICGENVGIPPYVHIILHDDDFKSLIDDLIVKL